MEFTILGSLEYWRTATRSRFAKSHAVGRPALSGFDFPNLENAGWPPLDPPAYRTPGPLAEQEAVRIEQHPRTGTEQP